VRVALWSRLTVSESISISDSTPGIWCPPPLGEGPPLGGKAPFSPANV
jgi:hypothetical protein